MSYDFFADKADKLKILEFIFNETDILVYDLGSAYGKDICEYKTVEEISSKFDLHLDEFGTTFQLWSPRHKGKPIFRRIELNPKYCKEHTFRYSTEGFGLIQLHLGGLKNNNLKKSSIAHMSEKGAHKWANINPMAENVETLDWKEIETTSRKLKYYINNKMAVRKIGSFGVLPEADILLSNGVQISH